MTYFWICKKRGIGTPTKLYAVSECFRSEIRSLSVSQGHWLVTLDWRFGSEELFAYCFLCYHVGDELFPCLAALCADRWLAFDLVECQRQLARFGKCGVQVVQLKGHKCSWILLCGLSTEDGTIVVGNTWGVKIRPEFWSLFLEVFRDFFASFSFPNLND